MGAEADGLAEILAAELGGVGGVITASSETLRRVTGSEEAASHLAAIGEALTAALRADAFTGPVISTSRELADYLGVRLAHAKTEKVHALFLDAKLQLLREETIATGSASEARIYPRDLIARALELGATGYILVHNHPSGDPTPSRADVDLTRRLQAAGLPLDIVLHDHLVVARRGCVSLREKGYLR